MPVFTIETTYHLPVFRQRTYTAGTLEDACPLAIGDHGWGDAKEDVETSGETYVTGIWSGADTAYPGKLPTFPPSFARRFSAKLSTFRKCSINLPMSPNPWACRRSTSGVGCRRRWRQLRRRGRSSRNAAIPMSRIEHYVSGVEPLAAVVSNAAPAAALVHRDA